MKRRVTERADPDDFEPSLIVRVMSLWLADHTAFLAMVWSHDPAAGYRSLQRFLCIPCISMISLPFTENLLG